MHFIFLYNSLDNLLVESRYDYGCFYKDVINKHNKTIKHKYNIIFKKIDYFILKLTNIIKFRVSIFFYVYNIFTNIYKYSLYKFNVYLLSFLV